MTIYVDDHNYRVGRMIFSHMVADTEAELHAMAGYLGISRRWYQDYHYDIGASAKRAALAHGALVCTQREAAQVRAALRRKMRGGKA